MEFISNVVTSYPVTLSATGLVPNASDLDTGTRFLNISGWTPQSNGSNSPVFANSVNYTKFSEPQSLVIGNIAGASTTHGKQKTLPLTYNFTNVDGITFWVYCDGPLATSGNSATNFTVLFALGDAGLANSSYINICGIGGGAWRRGWNNVRVSKKTFDTVANGGAGNVLSGTGVNWASVAQAQIRFTPAAPYTGNSVYIGGVCFGGYAQTNRKIPLVITLDDTAEDSYAMTKIMNAVGVPVTLFAICEYIDNHATYPGYLTWDQVTELYNQGNDVGVHGAAVNAFIVDPTLMQTNRQKLLDHGLTRNQGFNYLSYPNGTYNQTTIDTAKSYGFLAGRTIFGLSRNDSVPYEETFGAATMGTTNMSCLEMVANGGIANAFKINSGRPTTATEALANLDEAISRQSAFVLYAHQFSEFSQAEWTALAAGIATRIAAGTVEPMTFPVFCQRFS